MECYLERAWKVKIEAEEADESHYVILGGLAV